jgi:hypothetical protein
MMTKPETRFVRPFPERAWDPRDDVGERDCVAVKVVRWRDFPTLVGGHWTKQGV